MAMWEGNPASTRHVLAYYCSTSARKDWPGDHVSELRCLVLWRKEDHSDEK